MKTFLILILCLTQISAKPRGSRIIGGREAYPGEFSYAAAIYKKTLEGNYFCAGALLNNQWVLTAGQCVNEGILFTVNVGSHRLSTTDETVQRMATEHYVIHPSFNPLSLENDIGLIKFRLPIIWTAYVTQLNLPYADLLSPSVGTALGWGQVADDDPDLSDTLNCVQLVSVSDAECRITYGDQIAKNMVCYGGSFNEGACFGDSGSPMIQNIGRGYTIVIAIASFFSGNGCESTDPSGYTNVFPYNDWIENATST